MNADELTARIPKRALVRRESKQSMIDKQYVPRAGWSLVLGLFGLLPVYVTVIAAALAIVFGWQARQAYRASGQALKRHTVGIVGLSLGVLGVVINGGLFAFNELRLGSTDPIPPTRFHDLASLVVGTCYGPSLPDRPGVREIVDCNREHLSEVIARVELVGEPYPGADAVKQQAFERCRRQLELFVGVDPDITTLELKVIVPSARQWALIKNAPCIVYGPDETPVTGSFKGTGR
jgi:Septum formation